MEPLVSAVITTHNRKELLRSALQSVLKQTYSNMEVIVVDDGSTDGTKEYMESHVQHLQEQYSFPIKYIYNSDGGGGNHARNTGILNSKGEFVAFLDDDDEWLPEKTKEQVSLLKENTEIGFVSCGRVFEYDMKRRTNEDLNSLKEGDLKTDIFRSIPFTTSCMMIRRPLLLQVDLFDEKIRYWQEYELSIRLCQITPVGVVKKHLVLFRLNSGDKHRLTNHLNGWEQAVSYIEAKHKDLIEALPDNVQKDHLALIAWDGAMRCEANGDRKGQRQYLKQMMKLKPTLGNKVKYVLNRTRFRK